MDALLQLRDLFLEALVRLLQQPLQLLDISLCERQEPIE
jgi:hypothetical protein